MKLTGELHYHLEGKDYATVRFSEGVNRFSIDIIFGPHDFASAASARRWSSASWRSRDATGKEVFVTVRPWGQSVEGIISSLIRFYQQFGLCAD